MGRKVISPSFILSPSYVYLNLIYNSILSNDILTKGNFFSSELFLTTCMPYENVDALRMHIARKTCL